MSARLRGLLGDTRARASRDGEAVLTDLADRSESLEPGRRGVKHNDG